MVQRASAVVKLIKKTTPLWLWMKFHLLNEAWLDKFVFIFRKCMLMINCIVPASPGICHLEWTHLLRFGASYGYIRCSPLPINCWFYYKPSYWAQIKPAKTLYVCHPNLKLEKQQSSTVWANSKQENRSNMLIMRKTKRWLEGTPVKEVASSI